jgi:phage anti-repressor protein
MVWGKKFWVFYLIDKIIFIHTILSVNIDPGDPAKEACMLEVTEKANEKIQEFFKGKEEEKNIRIFLSQGG